MATLYDETFSSKGDQPMSIEEFEAKYYSSVGMSERLLQEAYAVSKLKRVFEDKDYD